MEGAAEKQTVCLCACQGSQNSTRLFKLLVALSGLLIVPRLFLRDSLSVFSPTPKTSASVSPFPLSTHSCLPWSILLSKRLGFWLTIETQKILTSFTNEKTKTQKDAKNSCQNSTSWISSGSHRRLKELPEKGAPSQEGLRAARMAWVQIFLGPKVLSELRFYEPQTDWSSIQSGPELINLK
jgi:hypothetical protein